MGTIHYSSTMNAPGPLPGCLYMAPAGGTGNAVYAHREEIPQVSRATIGGAFNGSRDLGFTMDGAAVHFDNAATAAAWATGMSALAIMVLLGVTVTIDGSDAVVTFTDAETHTLVGDVEPDSPDLTLGAFTNDQDPVPATDVAPGMAVVWLSGADRSVEAPRTGSTLEDYAGAVTLASRLPDDVAQKMGNGAGLLADGQPMEYVRKGTVTLAVGDGESVTDGDPVYFGTASGEVGFYFPSAGSGRVQVTGARFMQSATGAGRAAGIQAMFT